MLNFPQNPSVGTEHAVGVKNWRWNGYSWDLTSISEAQVLRAENAAAIAVEAANSMSISYLQKSDKISETVIYRGEALPGSVISSLAWRIRKLTVTYGDQVTLKTEFPNGERGFNHSWANRASYIYTV